jgi:hypothetical protein
MSNDPKWQEIMARADVVMLRLRDALALIAKTAGTKESTAAKAAVAAIQKDGAAVSREMNRYIKDKAAALKKPAA